jgi:hypothetical protein
MARKAHCRKIVPSTIDHNKSFAGILWLERPSPGERKCFLFFSFRCWRALAASTSHCVLKFTPTWGDILGTAIYVLVTILLAAAQAVAVVAIAYGFIATAV